MTTQAKHSRRAKELKSFYFHVSSLQQMHLVYRYLRYPVTLLEMTVHLQEIEIQTKRTIEQEGPIIVTLVSLLN